MGLERLHSKHVLHFFYMVGTIALEIFLGVRVGIMYQEVLLRRTHADPGEAFTVQILATAAVAIIGIILATWRHQALEAAYKRIENNYSDIDDQERMKGIAKWSMWIVIGLIVAHEVAAIMWMMWSAGFDYNAISVLIVIGMAGLSLSPFFLGIFTSSLGELLNEERKERLNREAGDLRDGLQIKAMRQYVDETRRGLRRKSVQPKDVLSDDTRQFLTGPVSFLKRPKDDSPVEYLEQPSANGRQPSDLERMMREAIAEQFRNNHRIADEQANGKRHPQ